LVIRLGPHHSCGEYAGRKKKDSYAPPSFWLSTQERKYVKLLHQLPQKFERDSLMRVLEIAANILIFNFSVIFIFLFQNIYTQWHHISNSCILGDTRSGGKMRLRNTDTHQCCASEPWVPRGNIWWIFGTLKREGDMGTLGVFDARKLLFCPNFMLYHKKYAIFIDARMLICSQPGS
jgi:hypothetical protein